MPYRALCWKEHIFTGANDHEDHFRLNPQIPLCYAPILMTTDRAARQVLWYRTIRQKTSGMPPNFQERSAELQIPPRHAGVGRMTKEAVATSGDIHPAAKPVEQMFRQHNRIESGASLSGVNSLIKFRRIVRWASPFVLVPRTLLRTWGTRPVAVGVRFVPGRSERWRRGSGSEVSWTDPGLSRISLVRIGLVSARGNAVVWPLRINSRKPCYRQW
jgi:hypothetical protein